MSSAEYDAFISYRRSDGRTVANWLRRKLETYRPPRKLRGIYARKLRVYLDTAYERGTNDFYVQSIRPALLASRHLIVIATPDAVLRSGSTNDWIQREVTDFARGPRGRNVLLVRGAGELAGKLPADLGERFPNIEIVDLRGVGYLSFLNPVLAGRLADEKLKLLAPLLDIPQADMPALRMEEEKRQQTRLGVVFGLSFSVLVLVAGASLFAFKSLWKAQDALDSSIFSTERMIQAISDEFPATGGSDDARANLLNQACDLVAKLAQQAARTPSIRERVLCEVERARGREAQKEYALAESILGAAVSLAEAADQRAPSAVTGRALVEARASLAEYLLRIKADGKAQAAIDSLVRDTDRLAARHGEEPFFLVAEGEALSTRASMFKGKEGAAARREAMELASARLRVAAAHRETSAEVAPSLMARQASLLAGAARASFDLGDLPMALERMRDAVGVRGRIEWKGAGAEARNAQNRAAIAELYVGIAAFEKALGHAALARDAKTEASTRLTALLNDPALPAALKEEVREVRDRLERLGKMEP